MITFYLFLTASSTYGLCCFILDIYRIFRNYPATPFSSEPPTTESGIRKPKPRPNQPGETTATAEVEGTASSIVP